MKIKTIILIVFVTIFSSCGNNKEVDEELAPRPVRYMKLSGSDTRSLREFSGLSKARKQSELSFKVSGTLDKRLVEMGDRVKEGQLLATIDPTDYRVSFEQSQASVKNSEARIRTAEAQMESAKANYISAESNYKRFQNLYEMNSVSLSDFEQAKANFEAAQANYEAAQTEIEAARASANSSKSQAQSASNQISYTQLNAPFSGIISEIFVEQNEAVAQGTPVMVINTEDDPQIEVGVPERVISSVEKNSEVEVRFTTITDQIFAGRVIEVGYSPSGFTYPVTIEITKADERIRPGMPADVRFDFSKKQTSAGSKISVPATAVGGDDKGNFVYLLKPTDSEYYIAIKKPVEVGEITSNGFEIKSGLNTGKLIATAGLNIIRDSMIVRLYESN